MAIVHANPMSNVTMPSLPVCGNRNFNSASETEKIKALKCAIGVVQKMRKNKEVQPNWRTYNLGLEAFGVILDKKSADYQKVIESVFVKCCNQGLVDDKVIKTSTGLPLMNCT